MLECASLTEQDFYETVAFILADEGKKKSSGGGCGAVDWDGETTTVAATTDRLTMTRTKLERIPGSIDGGSRELPIESTIAAPAPAPVAAAVATRDDEDDQSVPDMSGVTPPKFDRRSLDLGKISANIINSKSSSVSAGEGEGGPASPTRPPLSSDSEDAVVPSTSS